MGQVLTAGINAPPENPIIFWQPRALPFASLIAIIANVTRATAVA